MPYGVYKNSKSDPGFVLGQFETEQAAALIAMMMKANLKIENKRRLESGLVPLTTTYEVMPWPSVKTAERK